ncbi:hypothetical protein BGY98DRAFT_1050900 [Russula aff. rugulosa BPL654]|nr:hypothetical protein BGY98DRAFT_1050900 [Russula aff. rugulosa BPL654]
MHATNTLAHSPYCPCFHQRHGCTAIPLATIPSSLDYPSRRTQDTISPTITSTTRLCFN